MSKFHAGADSDAEGAAAYRVGVLLLCLWGWDFLWGGWFAFAADGEASSSSKKPSSSSATSWDVRFGASTV